MSKIVRLAGLKENEIQALTSAWVSANDLPWIIKEYEAKWFPLRVVLLESDEEVPWGMSHDYESFDSIRTAATRKMLDENAALRARIAALESSLPKTKDGEVVTLDLRIWSHVDGDDLYHGVEGRSGWGAFTVRGMCEEMIFVTQDGSDESDEIPPSNLYRRHPEIGLTPEEAEAKK